MVVPTACAPAPPNPNWQRLREDNEWMEDLSHWLDLVYVKRGDVAAFTMIAPHNLDGSLHATYGVVQLLKSVGADVPDQARIADWIESLRDDRGAYVDPFYVSHSRPSYECWQAVETLRQLGRSPQDAEALVDYLLSLGYGDGTFMLGAEDGWIPEETARERMNGTIYVVNTLAALGQTGRLPEATTSFLVSEIERLIGEESLPDAAGTEGTIAAAIRLLAIIDPALVSGQARDFIARGLRTMASVPPGPYLFTVRAETLLDAADLLGLPEAREREVIEALKSHFAEKILPQQNSTGGFGPSETIDPVMTKDYTILASRLGLTYPNRDKLLSEIESHWLGFGWATFLINQLDQDDLTSSYYGIEIARFAGFEYDKERVANFIRAFLFAEADSAPNAGDPSVQIGKIGSGSPYGLMELYHALKSLKALNGRLTQEERKRAESLCGELVDGGAIDTGSGYSYVFPISREAGFSLDQKTIDRVHEAARTRKESTIIEEESFSVVRLEHLWRASDPEGSVISKDEVTEYLSALYDEKTGSYVSPATDGVSIMQGVPAGTPRPDMVDTLLAMEVLSDMGKSLPDESRTIEFVFRSKQKYGFGREPTWPYEPNIRNTFAALMILERIK